MDEAKHFVQYGSSIPDGSSSCILSMACSQNPPYSYNLQRRLGGGMLRLEAPLAQVVLYA